MDVQPEPLARAAPAATGPAQATAATPLTTASTTPPNAETCLFIGQPSRYSIRFLHLVHPAGSSLVRRSAPQNRDWTLKRRAPQQLAAFDVLSPKAKTLLDNARPEGAGKREGQKMVV